MKSIDFTDEEFNELCWIFDHLVSSAVSSDLTRSKNIAKVTANCVDPSLLVSMYRKLEPVYNKMGQSMQFSELLSILESYGK